MRSVRPEAQRRDDYLVTPFQLAAACEPQLSRFRRQPNSPRPMARSARAEGSGTTVPVRSKSNRICPTCVQGPAVLVRVTPLPPRSEIVQNQLSSVSTLVSLKIEIQNLVLGARVMGATSTE